MGDIEELKLKKESFTGPVVMNQYQQEYFVNQVQQINIEEEKKLDSYIDQFHLSEKRIYHRVRLAQDERLSVYQDTYDAERNKIINNKELGNFKKKKALRQAESKHNKNVKDLYYDPVIFDKAKFKEAEQYGKQFIASETQYKADLMTVKTMLTPLEREYVDWDIYDQNGDSEFLNVLHSENIQQNIQANKSLIRNHIRRAEPEACSNFLADLELQVNNIPTDVFVFNSPAEFANNYTNINRATEKIKAIKFITSDPAYGAFIESHPERFKPFVDKIVYFTKCTEVLPMYRKYLATGSEYARGKEYDDIMKLGTIDMHYPQDYRSRIAEMSKERNITLGSTTFEQHDRERNAKYNQILKAKAEYEELMQAHGAEIADIRTRTLIREIYLKTKISKAYQRYEKLFNEFMPIYGYNERLLPSEYGDYDYQDVGEIMLDMEEHEEILEKHMQFVNECTTTLEESYATDNLDPVFKEALFSRYGKCVPKSICLNKKIVTETYAKLYELQERLRNKLSDRDVPEKYFETPPEEISKMAPSEAELEIIKLGLGTFRLEGSSKTLGESLFRSFSAFGIMDTKLTKEEVVQMLKNLGAGSNDADDPDPVKSEEIKAKQKEGMRLYAKAMINHYGGIKDKIGDAENLPFSEVVKKDEFHRKCIPNPQVDNHIVTRFPEFFATPEGAKLTAQVGYYNYVAMFLRADPAGVESMGLEDAKIQFEYLKKNTCANEEFKKFRKDMQKKIIDCRDL